MQYSQNSCNIMGGSNSLPLTISLEEIMGNSKYEVVDKLQQESDIHSTTFPVKDSKPAFAVADNNSYDNRKTSTPNICKTYMTPDECGSDYFVHMSIPGSQTYDELSRKELIRKYPTLMTAYEHKRACMAKCIRSMKFARNCGMVGIFAGALSWDIHIYLGDYSGLVFPGVCMLTNALLCLIITNFINKEEDNG